MLIFCVFSLIFCKKHMPNVTSKSIGKTCSNLSFTNVEKGSFLCEKIKSFKNLCSNKLILFEIYCSTEEGTNF